MNFKGKDRKVFEDIESAWADWCNGCCRKNCPVDEVAPGETDTDCEEWVCTHPAEAARLMGYEVVEEEPDNKETTPPCKWCQNEICVNADSPMRADYCPVPNVPGMCKYEEREKPMLKNITKIYLAGKITDDPDYKSKFERAEQDYISKGKIVLNPAKLPKGMGNADYMRICFAMLESADAAFFLPGWEQSAGAQLEYRWCLYTGKTIMYSTKKGEDK